MNPVIADWLIRPGGIAEHLRALRTRAGLLGKDMAERLSWTATRVSKLENGRQLPTADDLRQWAEACSAPERADELLDLLSEVQTVHLNWKQRAQRGVAPIQEATVDLVEQSKVVCQFETVFVPGLLQIPEYARVVLADLYELHQFEVHDVEQAVSARMRRQQSLYSPGKQFEFLITESVLRFAIVPPDVMRAQLDRLAAAIGIPNIRLGVTPFGVRLGTAPQNKFELYDDVALVEAFVGENTHIGDESAFYARVMERLWADAVEGDEARQLIIRAADALRP